MMFGPCMLIRYDMGGAEIMFGHKWRYRGNRYYDQTNLKLMIVDFPFMKRVDPRYNDTDGI